MNLVARVRRSSSAIALARDPARRAQVRRPSSRARPRRRPASSRATRSSPSTAQQLRRSSAGPGPRRDLRANAGQTVDLDGRASPTARRRAITVDAAHPGRDRRRRRTRTASPMGARGSDGVETGSTARTSRDLGDAIGDRRRARPCRWFGLILDGLGDLVAAFVTNPTARAAGRRPGRDRDPDRRHLLQRRPDRDAVRRGHPVGQPGAREHPAVPAARRRPDADDRPQAIFGARISLRAERLTYLVGFVFLFAFLIWITGFDIVRILGGSPT